MLNDSTSLPHPVPIIEGYDSAVTNPRAYSHIQRDIPLNRHLSAKDHITDLKGEKSMYWNTYCLPGIILGMFTWLNLFGSRRWSGTCVTTERVEIWSQQQE